MSPDAPSGQVGRRDPVVIAGRVLLGAGLVALWEFSPVLFGINPFWFSQPSVVARTAARMLGEGSLLRHIGVTLLETLLGLGVGSAVGIAVGVVLGRARLLQQLFEPYLLLANALPKVAMAPLFMIWFGVGLTMKVAVAFSLVVVVMALNTYTGVRLVRRELVDSARLMGATDRQIFVKIVLPSITPWLFAGFRVSVGFALIGAVLGEFIAAQGGLGFIIDDGLGVLDSSMVFLGLVLLLAISWAINSAVDVLGRRLGRATPDTSAYLA